MIKLSARNLKTWDGPSIVARLTRSPEPVPDHAYLTQSDTLPEGFVLGFRVGAEGSSPAAPRLVSLPPDMSYLSDGDIIRYSPTTGSLRVLYRRSSPHNTVFTTERCNSNCLMCSQPPRAVDDRHLVDIYLQAIRLMDQETPELIFTGGEPTLLGDDLLRLITACKQHLPRASAHVLSNGRMFSYLSLCNALASIGHPDLMVGIPVYADIASTHDFVVQAKGAFDQTIRGIMNLARYEVPVEIRVVLHRQTILRLPQLARFIGRNLPFVSQVALMGLEMMGYVKSNLEALWTDPADYQRELAEAVEVLQDAGLKVLIYNHQLCTLPPALWPFAVKSISDWKNGFLPECQGCSVRGQCGGFFSSSHLRRSRLITPMCAT